MKKLVTIGLAAATIAGAGLAFTVPASADDWQGRSYSNNDHRADGVRDREARDRAAREQALRERQGPRDRRVAHYEYHRNGCATYWHWSHGRYIRTDRCKR